GIPNNSQNKKIVCCIFDELSAVSCLETIKQGFDVKIVIYYAKESELLRLVKIVNQIIHRTVQSKINLEFYKISPGLPIMLLTEVTIELLSRIAKLNGIKRISLSLSTLIHPIDFLEEMVMRVYNETLIPYLPLSGLDTNILESAKEIGLDKYFPKIKKISKSMYYNSKQSRKKPEKIAEQAIMTRKIILIKMGPNNVHDILDAIRSKQ
ncbi:uncharacterized protein METZ01_LOCUS96118, partial [marine metagenome]